MAIVTSDPKWRRILAHSQIWDAHVHIGIDRDGNAQGIDKIVSTMKECKVNRAVVFPFFRLDPHSNWKKEAILRSKQGFRGIKLHPRSQNFSIMDPKAIKIYSFAEQNNLPILLHTGLGTENVSVHAEKIMREFKNLRLILGHAGFVDIERVVKSILRRPYMSMYLETSTLKVYDLYDILRTIPANKIIFGSDIPYADMVVGIEALIDVALMLGYGENDIQNMLYRNLAGCLGEIV